MSTTFTLNPLTRIQEVFLGDIENGTYEPSMINQLLLAVTTIVLIILIVNVFRIIAMNIKGRLYGSPWIIKDTKDGRHSLIVSQDPNDEDSVPLQRSLNERSGLEFTYSLWLFIEDWEYKKGAWKHVFHKGNADSWPNRAPGVWLAPNDNDMRIYMNTFDNIAQYVEIDNIPVGKWFHLGIVLKETTMDAYINGFLKKRVVMNGIPKQNFGNLYVNSFGGFSGYISRMRYYDYAVHFEQLEKDIETGPSMKMPYSAQQSPPYLAPYWWTSDYER